MANTWLQYSAKPVVDPKQETAPVFFTVFADDKGKY
jgi:hypothetical protein